MLAKSLSLALICTALSLPALADAGTPDKAGPGLEQEVKELRAQVDALEDKLDAQKAPSAWSRVHIGGYGSLDYSNLDSGKVIDLSRAVMFFGYSFTPTVRFNSEWEVEHAVTSSEDAGELEIEQAYVEGDVTPSFKVKGGLFLIPVGILNETHEPTRFYGVARNPVETAIVPTTWREAGLGASGLAGMTGLSYDFAVHSGFRTPAEAPAVGEDDERFLIEEGHQEAMLAVANDWGVTGRLRYTGLSWLDLAATLQYQSDVTQGVGEPGTEDAHAALVETHAIAHKGPFELRALYARWDIRNDVAEAIHRDVQDGYYFETSYRPLQPLGVFARYAVWDAGGPEGDTEKSQTNIGVNWWPVEGVVLKADAQWQGKAADDEGFNLGIGWQF